MLAELRSVASSGIQATKWYCAAAGAFQRRLTVPDCGPGVPVKLEGATNGVH